MADPTLQTFCCIRTNETRMGADAVLMFRTGPYNIVCIVSSLLGILGAVYQILPRHDAHRRFSSSYLRGRYIVVWLATADLLASSAVFIRSVSWLAYSYTMPGDMSGFTLSTFFCAVSSGWIQYFYTATCLWTLCYALDVFKVVNGKQGQPKLYHALCWGLPGALTVLGLSILYLPDLNCHEMGSNPLLRILPNYIFTYLPIAAVMVVNPILYYLASNKAEEVLVSVAGRFTEVERKQLRTLRCKFLSINIVFYFCWIPNLINAFLLWTLWADLPRTFLLFDWHLMAVVNPLQALLNALVYRTWGENQPKVSYPWSKKPLNEDDSLENSLLIEKENSSPKSDSSGSDDSKMVSIQGSYGAM